MRTEYFYITYGPRDGFALYFVKGKNVQEIIDVNIEDEISTYTVYDCKKGGSTVNFHTSEEYNKITKEQYEAMTECIKTTLREKYINDDF